MKNLIFCYSQSNKNQFKSLLMKRNNIFHYLKWTVYFAIFFCQATFSQNEGKVWYFGSNAGLDFNTNPPTILNDGQLNTLEGTASFADAYGNLLFLYRR